MILACELCQRALMYAKTILGSFEVVNNSVPRSASATVLPCSSYPRSTGIMEASLQMERFSQHERAASALFISLLLLFAHRNLCILLCQ